MLRIAKNIKKAYYKVLKLKGGYYDFSKIPPFSSDIKINIIHLESDRTAIIYARKIICDDNAVIMVIKPESLIKFKFRRQKYLERKTIEKDRKIDEYEDFIKRDYDAIK